MATIRKMRSKWQVIIRRKNYPTIVRSFIETEALKKEIKIMLAGDKKKTQKEIGELLDISVGTVNKLVKEIKKEKM